MKPRSVAYLIALVLLGVFVLANWNLVARTEELSFLVGRVRAPLGLLIVLLVALVFVIDLAAFGFARRAWGHERRTLTQELELLRLRADRAEESRINELRALVERETAAIRAQLDRLSDHRG
ncbi:MAG TPA: hypothetical protein VMU67_01515 [Steroidobacteraceae bacterium]|nr:hypothetical protein [Steroidobacteraceae bacterium]